MGVMAEDVPTAEELLAHADWLHQLARALVGDAGAGDVVQDTYEIALTQPPRRAGPLRPWLGGVARNVARMATRSRVRRERREEREEREGRVLGGAEAPTPEEMVARVQLHQRVANLVLELHEPLRSTVLLRFFEGLNASEIARAQGVAAATVRSRLKDALDRVRATLDAEHRGDRRAWVAVLVPATAAVPTTAAVLAGGLIVKTSMKLLVALVIVAVLVVGARLAGLWGGGDDGGDGAARTAPIAQPGGGSAPTAGTSAAAVRAGAARELPVIHDDDPAGPLRLEGQVIDEHDAPVGGAVVAIDANPARAVETEADGSFVFEGLIPRDYRLEATDGARYAGPARLHLDDKAEPVTLRLRPGGTVEVTVTDRQGGAPVAGADVELRATLVWKATTDAEGVARLRGVGPAWAPLAVRAAGFAPAAMILGVAGDPAAPERVAVALARGAAISGRVVDDGGAPVGGARVVAVSASEPLPVVDPRRDGVLAGADGRFTIPAVAAGTWRLTATHGELAPHTSAPITVGGERGKTGVELVMARGGVVRGVVKDHAGEPVAGADVRVVARGFVFWRARRQAFTDARGAFAFAGLALREVDVVARHDLGASAIVPVDLAAKRDHELALVLEVRGAIAGAVVDPAGEPIGDAQVIVTPEGSEDPAARAAWGVRGAREAVTDQAGAFRFAGLSDGAYRVRAARPGAPEAALSLSEGVVARPDAGPVRVVVRADGRVTGTVRLAGGTAPARFFAALGDTHARAFAGDGAFELAGPGGAHVLTIRGPGFVQTRREVTIVEGKATDLGTITVAAGRSIAGRVLDAHGAPVAGATVAAGTSLTGGGRELYVESESPGARSTETDERGWFALDGLPPASLVVVAGKDGVGRSASASIPPGSDGATLELGLAPTTGLAGKVTRGGAPVPDTIVIASPVGAVASSFFVTTGPDGAFALDALAPGAYIVYPMLGGGGNRPKDMYVRRVEVVVGARAHVDVDTSPGAGALAVRIKTDGGAAPPMAQVVAVGAAIAPRTPEELRDGSLIPFGDQVIPIYLRGASGGAVELEGLRPGPHTVCAVTGIGPFADPASMSMTCAQTKLGGGKQTVTITVPAK